jgi:transcription termination factor NusB
MSSIKKFKDALLEMYEAEVKGEMKILSNSENELIKTFLKNREKIDKLISETLRREVDSIIPIEKCILRISVSAVILGEKLEDVIRSTKRLSQLYCPTNSHKFLIASILKIKEKIENS